MASTLAASAGFSQFVPVFKGNLPHASKTPKAVTRDSQATLQRIKKFDVHVVKASAKTQRLCPLFHCGYLCWVETIVLLVSKFKIEHRVPSSSPMKQDTRDK